MKRSLHLLFTFGLLGAPLQTWAKPETYQATEEGTDPGRPLSFDEPALPSLNTLAPTPPAQKNETVVESIPTPEVKEIAAPLNLGAEVKSETAAAAPLRKASAVIRFERAGREGSPFLGGDITLPEPPAPYAKR